MFNQATLEIVIVLPSKPSFPKKQTGWRQYLAPTFFIIAVETQADTLFFRYIAWATSRFSGASGVMRRGMTEGASCLPASKGKVPVYQVKYAKKTDVLKKFW